jgi:hypothetical protein
MPSLELRVYQLIGRRITDCREDMHRLCKQHGYSLNIQDPQFNPNNIDYDSKRLNIKTDGNGIVTGFTVG